jgi:hypothetical protein
VAAFTQLGFALVASAARWDQACSLFTVDLFSQIAFRTAGNVIPEFGRGGKPVLPPAAFEVVEL